MKRLSDRSSRKIPPTVEQSSERLSYKVLSRSDRLLRQISRQPSSSKNEVYPVTLRHFMGKVTIMDNYSIHKGEKIRSLIEGVGAKLIYLPTYSPEFNPIENCWSKLKSILRQIGARTYPDLAKAIEFAFNKISLNDIRNWFIHCCYCTSLD